MLAGVSRNSKKLDSVSDQQLRAMIVSLREQTSSGNCSPDSDAILMQSLALAKQSLIRTSGMKAYDVQVLAGIAMSRGAIAEMQTGEGKTLTSTFPIVAHAIGAKGVHVATVNSYLAQRDFEFVSPALKLLGISVGMSNDADPAEKKREAYQCDVTFATGYELGFDFLRDQIALMSRGPERLGAALRRELSSKSDPRSFASQRSHALAIVDEIDSVLIDEAITPLVLSSGSLGRNVNDRDYKRAKEIAATLELDKDFVVDEQAKSLFLTQTGAFKVHEDLNERCLTEDAGDQWLELGRTHAFAGRNRTAFDMMAALDKADELAKAGLEAGTLLRPWIQYIESALRAEHIMKRDINYIVRDGKVEIVDEYTGRIFSDRNWRDGLHQAVEAKENVEVTQEKRTLARISRQRYFQRYDLLCGMTGTVSGHQTEMLSCYQLPIVVIPLRKKSKRRELPTRYFSTNQDKVAAVVLDVARRHQAGQPVLIGTRTIEQTLHLSECLSDKGHVHQVLNGVQDADEASLISLAGVGGSITVATNMAGRGTDIKPNESAVSAGGLHVIGFERNRSQRIDRQLLGRAGRQGDPGSGQFFVSADDEIIQRFDAALVKTLSRLSRSHNGKPNRSFDRRIVRIQNSAEKESLDQRKSVMREELWLDEVKKAVSY